MSALTLPGDHELLVLQLVRLKGRLVPRVVTELAADLRHLSGTIAHLADHELIAIGTSGAKLTTAGRERLNRLLDSERTMLDRIKIAAAYDRFHAPNHLLKGIVGAWQLRDDGAPNDHTDEQYDQAVLERFASMHTEATPLIEEISRLVPRLSHYPARLGRAMRKTLAGDRSWLASPVVDSYHQVWFELHEELIGLLGLTRADEAAAGRA